jgi:phosphotransferase system, enzyme I, PtsP
MVDDLESAPSDQVARVLDYLGFVAKSRPLSVLLDEAPRRIAGCVGADVASLYLLEGDGRSLVLRGNVGFPVRARGTVRLKIGEGITGRAVELGQPIAASHAPEHERYRGFRELEEERFPVFLAMPIIGSRGALGAIVVQRAERPFDEAETSLVAALTAPIAGAIRMARLLDDLRIAPPAPAGTRKVTLTGVPVVPGRALGSIAAVRRPSASTAGEAREGDAERLAAAIDGAVRAIKNLVQHARDIGLGASEIEYLESHLVMLDDQRLRRVAHAAIDDGQSLAAAIGTVVREATRAAADSNEPFLLGRARDLEQLCDALTMMADPDPRASLPSKAIVVVDNLGIYDLLVTTRAQPAGFVLTGRAGEPADPPQRSRALLELLGVPAVMDVVGVFRWVSPGDIALLDADHGLLVINPSRADIAAHRAQRRRAHRTRS